MVIINQTIKGDLPMRKLGSILLFLFLTGLFTGLFFSTCLSSENTRSLSTLLLTGITSSQTGFLKSFLTSLFTNFTLFALMLPALLSKYLCPLPPLVLWYKSFAIGFCSGLIWMGARSRILFLSLLHILPQNLFLIPGFFLCSLTILSVSLQRSPNRSSGSGLSRNTSMLPNHSRPHPAGSRRNHPHQKNSPFANNRLLFFLVLSALLLAAGSFTEAALRLAVLSPS